MNNLILSKLRYWFLPLFALICLFLFMFNAVEIGGWFYFRKKYKIAFRNSNTFFKSLKE